MLFILKDTHVQIIELCKLCYKRYNSLSGEIQNFALFLYWIDSWFVLFLVLKFQFVLHYYLDWFELFLFG